MEQITLHLIVYLKQRNVTKSHELVEIKVKLPVEEEKETAEYVYLLNILLLKE